MIHPVRQYFPYNQVLNQRIEIYENECDSETKIYEEVNEDDT